MSKSNTTPELAPDTRLSAKKRADLFNLRASVLPPEIAETTVVSYLGTRKGDLNQSALEKKEAYTFPAEQIWAAKPSEGKMMPEPCPGYDWMNHEDKAAREPLLSMNGQPVLFDDSMMLIHGRIGKGKSWHAAFFAWMLTTGTPLCGFKVHRQLRRVLYINTEMPISEVRARIQWLPLPAVKVFCIPELSAGTEQWPNNYEGRLDVIKKNAEQLRPELIIIDHILDLSNNPNDPTEGNKIADFLGKNITPICPVIITCHENDKDQLGNKFASGAVGSGAMKKASVCISVGASIGTDDGIVFKGTFTKFHRANTSPGATKEYAFRIEQGGTFSDALSAAQEQKKSEERQKAIEYFRPVFERCNSWDVPMTQFLQTAKEMKNHADTSPIKKQIAHELHREHSILARTGKAREYVLHYLPRDTAGYEATESTWKDIDNDAFEFISA